MGGFQKIFPVEEGEFYVELSEGVNFGDAAAQIADEYSRSTGKELVVDGPHVREGQTHYYLVRDKEHPGSIDLTVEELGTTFVTVENPLTNEGVNLEAFHKHLERLGCSRELVQLSKELGGSAAMALEYGEAWERNDERLSLLPEKNGCVLEHALEDDPTILLVVHRWHPPRRPLAMQFGAQTIDTNSGEVIEVYSTTTGSELSSYFDRALAIAEK